MRLKILSGGAANGLINAIRNTFKDQTGCEIDGDFGAVGGMRDRISNGEFFDIAILTRSAIEALVSKKKLDPDSVTDLGHVATGIAVKSGCDRPILSHSDDIAKLFRDADALFCPDTVQATAGIHFASVLDRLGVKDLSRLKEYPNGQTAMAAMAESSFSSPIGCTQVTEILNTLGVDYVGPLPEPFALDTVYTAAISVNAAASDDARALLKLLADTAQADLRRSVGFT